MTLDIRPVSPDELSPFVRVPTIAFGGDIVPEEEETLRAWLEFDRTLAAFDGDEVVGSAAAISYQLTLPGCVTTRAAGVTFVSVLPTHRRRGILSSLMRRQLDDVRERGEALAILYASESLLYGRFGYGLATTHLDMSIDRRHGQIRPEIGASGTLTVPHKEEAESIIPPLFDRLRHLEPDQINRAGVWWTDRFRDPERHRDGAGPRHYVVHRDDHGVPDGYCVYRIRESWPDGNPANILELEELIAGTDAAYASLWRYCLAMDLIADIETHKRPTDEPLRWMLADPRRLRVKRQSDGLWARIIDVPSALSARRYTQEGSIIVEVQDSLRSDTAGRYLLEGGPDGADCRRTRKSPDLCLDIADLGAVYLGGVTCSVLARAARVEEMKTAALTTADGMFTSPRAPRCSTGF